MIYNDFETYGSYEPGFFHLNINTTEEIVDLNKLLANPTKARLFSTFLHEYIHFLQEITTTCGVLTAGKYVDFIKEINNEIRNDGKFTFKVPYNFSNKFNAQANIKLASIYRGESKEEEYAKYEYYMEEKVEIETNDGSSICPKKYIIYYYLKTGQLKQLHFGYTCLKEFVAHTIQSKFCPEVIHPEIPYKIVEQIATKECPTFGTDPMKIVSLCDACLMSLHPAQLFFTTLKRMKEDGFTPSSHKHIYDYILKDANFYGPLGSCSVDELFKKSHKFTRDQLDDALSSPIFLPNKQWMKHILEQAMNLRLTSPTFITNLVDGKNKVSPKFLEIVRELGTPFFTNAEFKGAFIPPGKMQDPAIQPYQLLVFREILSIFGGNTSCGLLKFCEGRTDKDITNDHCKISPWMRGSEGDLCPFGQFWKTWGLNGEIPVRE